MSQRSDSGSESVSDVEVQLFGIVVNPAEVNTQPSSHFKVKPKEEIANFISQKEKKDRELEDITPPLKPKKRANSYASSTTSNGSSSNSRRSFRSDVQSREFSVKDLQARNFVEKDSHNEFSTSAHLHENDFAPQHPRFVTNAPPKPLLVPKTYSPPQTSLQAAGAEHLKLNPADAAQSKSNPGGAAPSLKLGPAGVFDNDIFAKFTAPAQELRRRPSIQDDRNLTTVHHSRAASVLGSPHSEIGHHRTNPSSETGLVPKSPVSEEFFLFDPTSDFEPTRGNERALFGPPGGNDSGPKLPCHDAGGNPPLNVRENSQGFSNEKFVHPSAELKGAWAKTQVIPNTRSDGVSTTMNSFGSFQKSSSNIASNFERGGNEGGGYKGGGHQVTGRSDRNYLGEYDTNEDIRLENQAADLHLRRLEREGITLSRNFTSKDPLADKLFEIETHSKGKEMLEWVNGVRNMISLGATGLDVVNDLAGPVLKLRSDNASWVGDFMDTTLEKLTEPLKKIYVKHVRKSDQNPFFQIMMIVVGSLVMFHFREVIREKSMCNNSTSSGPILPKNLNYTGVRTTGVEAPDQSRPIVEGGAVSAEDLPMMEEP